MINICRKYILLFFLCASDVRNTVGFSLFGMQFGGSGNDKVPQVQSAADTLTEPKKTPMCIACYGDMVGHEVSRVRWFVVPRRFYVMFIFAFSFVFIISIYNYWLCLYQVQWFYRATKR